MIATALAGCDGDGASRSPSSIVRAVWLERSEGFRVVEDLDLDTPRGRACLDTVRLLDPQVPGPPDPGFGDQWVLRVDTEAGRFGAIVQPDGSLGGPVRFATLPCLLDFVAPSPAAGLPPAGPSVPGPTPWETLVHVRADDVDWLIVVEPDPQPGTQLALELFLRVEDVAPDCIAGDWKHRGLAPVLERQARVRRSKLLEVVTADDLSDAMSGCATGVALVPPEVARPNRGYHQGVESFISSTLLRVNALPVRSTMTP